ncbi:MAG: nitrilase-related carbon-nitrogen hydrolase [Lutibacter sp.]
MKKIHLSLNSIKSVWFLAIGIVSFALTHMSYSVDFFAWFSVVPFLIYLSVTKGWKTRLYFVLALIVAWSLVVLKIVTPPIPYAMIFLFSVPISLFHLPAYLIWDKYKKNKWSIFLFPVILTIMEWIQYTFTPFASWGVMAYSQSHSINVMQFTSIFGMAGLSFLIYWVNVSIAKIITIGKTTLLSFYLPILSLLLIIIFGSLRIDIGKSKGVKTMTVAAVGTNSEVSGLPLPTKESNGKVISDLLKKTEKAADFGAELIVWNEASFFTLADDETTTINLIKTIAKKKNISIVASYVMPISEKPFQYENKFVFINKNGETEYSYLKHQPVPGEPAIKGTKPFKTVRVSESEIGGAICYDYDFPYIAQEFGNLKTDIVAVPSSDWRGIDPLHTRMSAFRAIEQGHSIVRSTRFGLSAAITPYGEMISQMSSFDKNNKVMTANLPVHRIITVYSIIGDIFIYLCFTFVIFFFLNVSLKK